MANEYNIPPNNPSVEPVDWTSITKDLITNYGAIKKEREVEKEKLDSLVDVNSRILEATQLGKTPSANEFILKGTQSGKAKMSEWNRLLKAGQLSPSEYKRRINNLMDHWNQLAITNKTYDERMQEIFKNQQPDEKGQIKGSALELERLNELAQYQDLSNKDLIFDDNGNAFLGKLNNGLLDPTSVKDIRSLNNFSNILDNKIQLSSLVDEGTKNWKSFKIENGVTTTNDIRQNKDAYAKAKATLINGILSNDNAVASVLSDYTKDQYDYYKNNDEFISRVEKRIKSENDARQFNDKPPMNKEETEKFIESQKSKFILLEHDDQSVSQPKPTEEQYKAAFDAVDNEIEIRMGKEESSDEPYRGGSSSSKSDDRQAQKDQAKQAEDNANMLAGFKASKRAFGGDFSGLNKAYTYKAENGGVTVTYPDARKTTKVIKKAQGLAQFIFNGEPAEALDKWNKGQSLFNNGKSKPATNKTTKKDPLGLGL